MQVSAQAAHAMVCRRGRDSKLHEIGWVGLFLLPTVMAGETSRFCPRICMTSIAFDRATSMLLRAYSDTAAAVSSSVARSLVCRSFMSFRTALSACTKAAVLSHLHLSQ